ncbi:hypothetical protein CHS0354_015858 [Potamilus streckersoni]|uniref:Uncharacterized protein n=1 Tax=Potamilus streckersoni TaxID=2493646 RepID=A0AAE0SDG6_9BIVA|nr:hypothetical protein CHS0354_015858 [Potamilus streckersoni]
MNFCSIYPPQLSVIFDLYGQEEDYHYDSHETGRLPSASSDDDGVLTDTARLPTARSLDDSVPSETPFDPSCFLHPGWVMKVPLLTFCFINQEGDDVFIVYVTVRCILVCDQSQASLNLGMQR